MRSKQLHWNQKVVNRRMRRRIIFPSWWVVVGGQPHRHSFIQFGASIIDTMLRSLCCIPPPPGCEAWCDLRGSFITMRRRCWLLRSLLWVEPMNCTCSNHYHFFFMVLTSSAESETWSGCCRVRCRVMIVQMNTNWVDDFVEKVSRFSIIVSSPTNKGHGVLCSFIWPTTNFSKWH